MGKSQGKPQGAGRPGKLPVRGRHSQGAASGSGSCPDALTHLPALFEASQAALFPSLFSVCSIPGSWGEGRGKGMGCCSGRAAKVERSLFLPTTAGRPKHRLQGAPLGGWGIRCQPLPLLTLDPLHPRRDLLLEPPRVRPELRGLSRHPGSYGVRSTELRGEGTFRDASPGLSASAQRLSLL